MPVKVYDGSRIREADDNEVDYEMLSPNAFFSSHINLIPLQSAVQGPRLFYGARFYNQATPLVSPEAPLVQNLSDDDEQGRSFDDIIGKTAGALYSDDEGEVTKVEPDYIHLKLLSGEKKKIPVYNKFAFNRKTAISQTPTVAKGDLIKPGQLLARSNYTDEEGALAMGTNARVGIVPYKGYSMDDAIVVSESFAKRLTSQHSYTRAQDFDNNTKGGFKHFKSLFPTEYTKDQLETLDENGVVKPGTILKHGDPMILATRPRVISSTGAQLGKLSRAMRQARSNASQVWEDEHEGRVVDVAKTKKGYKVVVESDAPTEKGDKIVFRSGQKGVISRIIPDEQMPRTVDGVPLEVLLNPLSIPSRTNSSIIYELLLGKIAAKRKEKLKLPSFNKPGENWYEMVKSMLDGEGIKDVEEVFDPTTNRKLDNPITVGTGYILKLHHTAASKGSSRAQGGYDVDQQPLKGGSDAAQAKRMSGLEVHSMLSAGAYKNIKEGATLRGQKNDEYWRMLRMGQTPKEPGSPFVWDKFLALLSGAGLQARKIKGQKGGLRLGPFTDADLEGNNPLEIVNGDMINLRTMEPKEGGLFDKVLVGSNKWGKISLPNYMPNPAFEGSVRHLLGMTQKELRDIMLGRAELPERLRK